MSDLPSLDLTAPHIRLAQPADLPAIDWLDTFGSSPHRNISRQVEQYFGSVDPSIHERNLIFLVEIPAEQQGSLPHPFVGKAELMLAPEKEPSTIGYIKRVVVHPAWRRQNVGHQVLDHIRTVAPEYGVHSLDLHVWEGNQPAIKLYDHLGFRLRHRELYLRLDLDDPATQKDDPQ